MAIVRNIFGGKDEALMTVNFEDLVGGVVRAQIMLKLWINSYPYGTKMDFLCGRGKTREQVFEDRAKTEGFTDEQIKCFYELS